DQFSFCVALYEALYRTRPFVGISREELCKSVLAGAVCEPPRGSKTPGWLFAVLRRGLAVDPGQRYPSMAELLADLGRDPVQTRRRWFLGVGFGILAAAAGLAAGQLTQRDDPRAPMCNGGAVAIAKSWNPPRRERLEAHLNTMQAAYADTLGQRLVTQLDDYAARWQEIHHDACIKHQEGVQSDLLLDKRMTCLARSLAAFDSAVEVLGNADEQVFQSATTIVYDLPPLYTCSDSAVLEAEVPPPVDPQVAAEVEAARENLARATTLTNAGKLDEALALTTLHVEQARQVGYDPLLAEALLLRGRIEFYQTGDARKPADTLLEAAEAGLSSRADAVAVEALIRGLHIEAIRPGGRAIGEHEHALIRSMLHRLPDAARLEGMYLNNAATVAIAQGELGEARLSLHQALAVKQRSPDINPIDLLETRFNLA
ncbi:MAG: hypothetical protein KC431_25495, partial [Myxococcales bacterium]|nr:hypothetical protein [Myxococcales bacterium]